MSAEKPFLGIVEGFYGTPWSWEARESYCSFLKDSGYSFYIYAPKGDRTLRRGWTERWPDGFLRELGRFRDTCRKHGIQFGIGLSPYEVYLDYNAEKKAQLVEKVRYMDEVLEPDILGALFDDMRGDLPGLADLQCRILGDVLEVCKSKRIIFCPTYYSLDPILERLFGPPPSGYFSALGSSIDRKVDIFWTGPAICSTEYPRDHLEWIGNLLRRKPFIWDNYPVNDDEQRSPLLQIDAFTNRPSELVSLTSGHAVNPMRQPWLSQIPLRTLPMSYDEGSEYDPRKAFAKAVKSICGENLAQFLSKNLQTLQIRGVDALSESEKATMRKELEALGQSACAGEIKNWLAGMYRFDPSIFLH